jgi:hypothetical protein
MNIMSGALKLVLPARRVPPRADERAGVRVSALRLRYLAVAAALAASALVIGLLVVRSRSAGMLPVDVRVLATDDPLRIGATTSARVELYNRGHSEMHPHFALTWTPYPQYWKIVSGSETLAPRTRETYVIEAPTSASAPYDGQTFQIKVSDGKGTTFVTTAPVDIEPKSVVIANPELALWSQRDGADALTSPAGWYPYKHVGEGDQAIIEPLSVAGVDAAHFRVVQDGQPDPGGWSHGGFAQEVPFPRTAFGVRVLSNARYEANEAGWPLTAFGLEVNDSGNAPIWLLFQQTGDGDRDYDLPNGQHIHVYDVPIGQWVQRTVDLPALYGQLHWKTSDKIGLKLFIAASSARRADIEGYVARLITGPETGNDARTAAR